MRIEAGRFRGRRLPTARGARPVPGRLRASLFGALRPRLAGARVLDLFAGVGALGLEALSEGAASLVLVERDRRAARALEAWIEAAGAAEQARVVVADALGRAVPAGPFDLVFADPPFALWRDEARARRLLEGAVARLAPGGLVAIKHPARAVLPEPGPWVVRRRRAMGEVAWALLGPPGDS